MRILRFLICVCALSCTGCSAFGTRVVGGGYFSGVRGDAAMIGDRESIDPSSRIHPALAVLDMPFSFVGDILFLPYDACQAQPANEANKRDSAKKNRIVTVEYIAHACFRVTSPSGKQILLDPYASRVWLGYDFPSNLQADAVLISHPHYDHDGGEAMGRRVPWSQKTPVLRTPGTNRIDDVTVVGFAGKHADPWGKEFGQINTIWLLEVGGLRIVHLGDNGPLHDDNIRQLGRVDVLMMPIDSQFHILKSEAIATIRRRLSPAVLIPMHYRHDDLEPVAGSPEALGGIDGWAKGEANVRYLDTHTHDFSVDTLPKKPEVLIFKHSPLVRTPK